MTHAIFGFVATLYFASSSVRRARKQQNYCIYDEKKLTVPDVFIYLFVCTYIMQGCLQDLPVLWLEF
jgi:hypothetical protein